jgi:hypothetical protein
VKRHRPTTALTIGTLLLAVLVWCAVRDATYAHYYATCHTAGTCR